MAGKWMFNITKIMDNNLYRFDPSQHVFSIKDARWPAHIKAILSGITLVQCIDEALMVRKEQKRCMACAIFQATILTNRKNAGNMWGTHHVLEMIVLYGRS